MSHCICLQIADFKELDKAVKDAKSVVVVVRGVVGMKWSCAVGHRRTCTAAPHIFVSH